MNIIEVYRLYPTKIDCLKHLEKVRWNNKPTCPYCESKRNSKMKKENRYHCLDCRTSYRVTVGTIFHNTKLDMQKWFLAISMILNAKKGVSARQLARHIDVTKDTAWYLGMRIRKALKQQGKMLQGIVEMDETYIGGKARKTKDKKNKRGRGSENKKSVVGMVERKGKIKAEKTNKVDGKTMKALVRGNIDTENTILMTDEFKSYLAISTIIEHQTINHQKWYVDGNIHTNTIESFWSLLKRGIVGQFHKVSEKWLPKYIDEFCFRHNERNNIDIFGLTLKLAVGVNNV
jgi:transposase-like protein